MYIIVYLYILYNIVLVEIVVNLVCRIVFFNGFFLFDKISVFDFFLLFKLDL